LDIVGSDSKVGEEVRSDRRVLKRRRRREDGSDLLWFGEVFENCFSKKRLTKKDGTKKGSRGSEEKMSIIIIIERFFFEITFSFDRKIDLILLLRNKFAIKQKEKQEKYRKNRKQCNFKNMVGLKK
jgi:hypothetical protein